MLYVPFFILLIVFFFFFVYPHFISYKEDLIKVNESQYIALFVFSGSVKDIFNLVSRASFCYKRKARKRNISNTWLEFAQTEGIFFRINYGIRGRRY